MRPWITNHHICSKLAWYLLIYDFPVTQANRWQALIQPFFRRWVGLAAASEASVLYRSHEHFGLNFKHLGDMLQRLQVVKWHIMKYSRDKACRDLYHYRLSRDKDRHYGKGRKTSPCLQLEDLEGDAKIQDIIGNAQRGKTGIGYRKARKTFLDPNKERRHQIGLIMRREAERKRLVLLENYQLQNSWLKWGLSDMMAKDLTWNKILTGYSDKLLKFVLNSNLQTMATPDNLKRWNILKDAPCGLCTKVNVGLSHILAGCPWVLHVENKLPREDRNTWRHNCVLLELAGAIRRKIVEVNSCPRAGSGHHIRFVPAGVVPPRSTQRKDFGILDLARDWTCDFHLPELHQSSTYHIPFEVDVSTLMCDGFIMSRSKKIFIILELTVPMEENIERWHLEKLKRYSNLTCPGWQVHLFMLEIGCRGFVPTRFISFLRKVGFTPSETSKLRDNLQLVARKCSYIIWINRFNKDFNSTLRVSVDGVLLPDCTNYIVPPSSTVPISDEAKDRISRNHQSALLKLRATRNRRSALLKLRASRNQSCPSQAPE